MSGSVASRSVALVVACALALVAPRTAFARIEFARLASAQDASIENEWRVRAWALDLEGTRNAWRAAAASELWTERHAVLDALVRAGEAGVLAARPGDGADGVRARAVELARRALDDAQPNLVALAARVLVLADAADAVAFERAASLCDAPLAETRAAGFALLAARTDAPLRAAERIVARRADADDEVRDAAHDALTRIALRAHAAAPDAVVAAARVAARALAVRVRELLERDGADEEPACERLAPLAGTAPVVAGFLVEAADALDPDAPAAARARRLVRATAAAAGHPIDAQELVDTWCTSPWWSAARDASFERALVRRGAGAVPELVRAAQDALLAFSDRGDALDDSARSNGLRALAATREQHRYPLASILLRAAHAAGGTGAVLDALEGASDATALHAFGALGPLLTGWTRERVERWWERSRSEPQLARALDDAWTFAAREGDALAREALERSLDEALRPAGDEAVQPGGDLERSRSVNPVALELFRALARLPDPRPAFPALRRAVVRAHGSRPAESLEFVRLLPAAAVDDELTEHLLARGRRAPDERGAIAHALRARTGDEDAVFQLERWALELLDALESGAPAERRNAQDVAAQLVPALVEVGGAQSVPTLRLLLDWSVGRAVRIGRLAVRGLGATPEGRAVLLEQLGGPLDRELESEALLALVASSVPRAEFAPHAQRITDALLALEGRIGIEDRSRRFAALGRLDTPAGVDALIACVLEEDGAAEEALAALGATSVASERLDRIARDTRSYEVRRGALAVLERRGARDAIEAFQEDWSALADAERQGWIEVWTDGEWGRRNLGIDLALPAHPEELAVVRGYLVGAIARVGAEPSDWWGEVFSAPLRRVERDLRERFAGRTASDPGFEAWAELELAGELARRGAFAEALGAVDGWERLDGELLLALARVAAGGRDAEAALALARAAIAATEPVRPYAGGAALRARAIAAEHAWAAEDFAAAAVLLRALADPFVRRSVGRADPMGQPLPGGDAAGRRALWRRALWAEALAAAQRGAVEAARDRLARAEVTLADDPGARDAHAAVVARVDALVGSE